MNETKKRPHRLLLLALFVLALLAGLQAATQVLAWQFGYNNALGWRLGYWYPPWNIVIWHKTLHVYTHFQQQLMIASASGMGVFFAFLMGIVGVKTILSNSAKANATLHGSARWANKKDIQAAGLLAQDKKQTKPAKADPAVFVGAWQGNDGKIHYLKHSGPEHVLCFAPTRSGKGVGLVIPTLLSWHASCVITDLKGELWALTAGWRKQGAKNKVLRFEPDKKDSVRWNPLDEIRLGTDFEVSDVQNLTTLIVDPDGKGLNDHWQKTAFALLNGVILFALYQAQEGKLKKDGMKIRASLAAVDYLMADPDRPIDQLWEAMTQSPHSVIKTAGQDMKSRPAQEGGSVLSTAKSYLALYRDPVVASNIETSDFRVRDLMHHDSPLSLYIVANPNDKARLRPLMRILISMIVRLLADKMDFKDGRPVAHYKHRLLMMLDEFPSLGKLDIMQESLAFVAGYGIKCYLICQDISQLKSRETGYGHDESITSNCHVQNAYPPGRIETAEHLSKLTGQTTVVKEQITTSGKRGAMVMGQVSRTFQETQRPLLTPDEAMRMTGPKKNARGEIEQAGEMLIYVAGYPAIRGIQPLYFKDKIFNTRAAMVAPETDRICRETVVSDSEAGDAYVAMTVED